VIFTTVGRRLLNYVLRRRRLLILTLLFSSITSLIGLFIPLVARDAINVMVSKSSENLLNYGLMIVFLSVVGGLLAFAQRYYSGLLSESVVFDLRNDLYSSLQNLSFGFYSRSDTGQIIARATSDVESVKRFISFAITGFTNAIITVVLALVIMMSIDLKLTLISLLPLPLMSILVRITAKRVRRLFEYARNIYGDFTSIIRESIIGIKVIKAFCGEEHFSKKFLEDIENYRDSLIKVGKYRALLWPTIGLISFMSLLLIYWFGGILAMEKEITVGDLIAFSIYIGMITWPMVMLGFITVSYERAKVSASRVFEIMDMKSDIVEDPNAVDLVVKEGKIEFKDIWFSYDNRKWILKGINLTVNPGEKIVLVGPTGSGKTTLVQLLPRFFDPQRGVITIDGVDIRKVKLDSLRKNIGIVHQDIYLFPDTIRNNIAYGKPDATLAEIIEAAKIARIHDFISSLPKGYDTIIGERGITLSGGQRQRLAIARTLITNPKIIILDDSLSNIDADTEQAIYDALSKYFKGKTVIIISHRPSTLRLADRIVVLFDGKIVEEGTFDELMKGSTFFSKIIKSAVKVRSG